MTIPAWVHTRLQRDFGGRFRVRWTGNRGGEFLVEQKLAPGQVIEPPTRSDKSYNTNDDAYIQARDGFGFVFSIRPGTRMPCPIDGTTLDVPIRQTRETVCPTCRKAGREGRYRAAYYPIDSEVWIEHLRFLDPLSGGVYRVRERVLADNARREKSMENDALNQVDAAGLDNFGKLFDIKSVGYTGKEHAWVR